MTGLKPVNRMSIEDYRHEMGLACSLNDVNTLGPSIQKEAGKRLRKFGNEPTVYDSPLVGEMKYPSIRQMERAKALDLLWRGGEILWWLPEVPIRLKAHTETRQRVMRVDFLICWANGTVSWEDAKGVTTEAWSLKRDIVKEQYGITIETV